MYTSFISSPQIQHGVEYLLGTRQIPDWILFKNGITENISLFLFFYICYIYIFNIFVGV